ncbi:MAG TPA: K(+)-transporting ATPase subunit C [Candidatus Hydrogenedentes bacterium]|nr:K(+)-transporting ATPase subunit C [Candidatus Hydrogenedentota bacterium]HOS02238.1 K(+)-transporting ATPase subunit C [Candidatus Hydrogenedentota bacterium]
MRVFAKELLVALLMTAVLVLIVCGAYPIATLVIAQGLFPKKANGSIIYHNGAAVGSRLLGQPFKGPQYFHPRPSAAGDGYDGTASGGSNLGPTSKELTYKVGERVREYREENGLSETDPVPADAVTASGSGLDPHISLKNALLQAPRVAKARGWDVDIVNQEIRAHIEGRTLGVLGEPRVNVLLLNLALNDRATMGK